MLPKYFNTPFAASGEKSEIVELTQTDGTVSYQEGYGPDYAKNQEDVGAKFIERAQMNGLFNEITANLKQWQEQGLYPYNPEIAYTIGGRCCYDDGSGLKAYISTIGNNTNPPGIGGVVQSGWQLADPVRATPADAKAGAGNDLMTPGLIQTALDQFGMFGNSVYLSDSDNTHIKLNDITYNSFCSYYRPNTGSAESLPWAGHHSFLLLTINHSTGSHLVQVAFNNITESDVKMRFKRNNAWSSWQSLGNKGINTASAYTTLSWAVDYQAPSNGTFYADGTATAPRQQIRLYINGKGFDARYAYAAGNYLSAFLPVRKGQLMGAHGDLGKDPVLRFYPD